MSPEFLYVLFYPLEWPAPGLVGLADFDIHLSIFCVITDNHHS
jgi:hypothetical protein